VWPPKLSLSSRRMLATRVRWSCSSHQASQSSRKSQIPQWSTGQGSVGLLAGRVRSDPDDAVGRGAHLLPEPHPNALLAQAVRRLHSHAQGHEPRHRRSLVRRLRGKAKRPKPLEKRVRSVGRPSRCPPGGTLGRNRHDPIEYAALLKHASGGSEALTPKSLNETIRVARLLKRANLDPEHRWRLSQPGCGRLGFGRYGWRLRGGRCRGRHVRGTCCWRFRLRLRSRRHPDGGSEGRSLRDPGTTPRR